MFGTKPEVVLELRSMAIAGHKPSELLETINSCHPDGMLVNNTFCRYFKEAFCFADVSHQLLIAELHAYIPI